MACVARKRVAQLKFIRRGSARLQSKANLIKQLFELVAAMCEFAPKYILKIYLSFVRGYFERNRFCFPLYSVQIRVFINQRVTSLISTKISIIEVKQYI